MTKPTGKPVGRPKEWKTILQEALDKVEVNLPALVQTLIDKAIAGDKDCAIYLIDRKLGKPKQAIDMKTEIDIVVTPEMIQHKLEEVHRHKIELLGSGVDISEIP